MNMSFCLYPMRYAKTQLRHARENLNKAMAEVHRRRSIGHPPTVLDVYIKHAARLREVVWARQGYRNR